MIETRAPREQRPGVERRRRVGRGALWLSPVWPLLLILGVWVGERVVGERWWVTTWLLYLPQLLYLAPSALMAGLALLLRRWRALFGHMLVALLGAFLLLGGAYRLPGPPVRGDIRVMTWNIRGLLLDHEGVLAGIRREKPDILLLQETEPWPHRDPVDWLGEKLGWNTIRGGDVAILTPHALGPTRKHRLGGNRLPRVALRAPVRVDGRSVHAIAVHLHTALPRPIREEIWKHPRHYMEEAAEVRIAQTDDLARVIQSLDGPLIVGGDFNSPPASYADRTMSGLLENAFAAGGSGFGWSFPARQPLLRIDHLYASRDLRVTNCRVLPLTASDHRPVVADLVWR